MNLSSVWAVSHTAVVIAPPELLPLSDATRPPCAALLVSVSISVHIARTLTMLAGALAKTLRREPELKDKY